MKNGDDKYKIVFSRQEQERFFHIHFVKLTSLVSTTSIYDLTAVLSKKEKIARGGKFTGVAGFLVCVDKTKIREISYFHKKNQNQG